MDIKCLIVDDDLISNEILKTYISSVQGIELIGECTSALDAFDFIHNKHVDLVFLDIEMPKLTGIDFIKSLKMKKLPRFVIASASKEYAAEGYELDLLDYLVKPIHFERFLKSIDKYYQQSNGSSFQFNHFAPLHTEKDAFIYIRESKKVLKLYLKDILYIESVKNYVKIVTTSKSIVTKQQISYFEEVLPKENFLRIHRSFMISIAKIEAFTSSEIEKCSKTLPIGRSYKQIVLNNLNFTETL